LVSKQFANFVAFIVIIMASECGPIRSRGRGMNQVKSSHNIPHQHCMVCMETLGIVISFRRFYLYVN